MKNVSVREQVGQRIADTRRALGMSQFELADAMRQRGYGSWRQSTVAKIESGARSLPVDELVALSVDLGVTPGSLLAGPVSVQQLLQQQLSEANAELRRKQDELLEIKVRHDVLGIHVEDAREWVESLEARLRESEAANGDELRGLPSPLEATPRGVERR